MQIVLLFEFTFTKCKGKGKMILSSQEDNHFHMRKTNLNGIFPPTVLMSLMKTAQEKLSTKPVPFS